MANNENLKKGALTQFRSGDDAANNGRKGGIASGKSRRRKAALRQTMNRLLTMQVDIPGLTDVLKADGGDGTYEEAISMAMIEKALQGNVKAFHEIKEVVGQTSKSEADMREQEAKIDLIKAQKEKIEPVNDEDDMLDMKDPHDVIIPEFWELLDDEEHEHHILTSGRAGTKSS